MFEPAPETLQALIETVNSDLLKVCLDIGHLHVFSRVPCSVWFDSLGDNIIYCHFNDNHGEVDEELPPGDGTLDWAEIDFYLSRQAEASTVVLEVGSLEAVEKSVSFLESHNVFPFKR